MRQRIAPLPNYASRSGPILRVFEWTINSDGTVTLPAGFVYTCASAGRTTQTSASTVKSSIGVNACPWLSLDGTTKRPIIECERTPMVKNNLGWLAGATGWLGGAGTATRTAGQTDPAGGTGGVQFAGVAGNTGPGFLCTTGSPVVYQMWTKRISGALGANNLLLAGDGSSIDPYVGNVVTADLWTLNKAAGFAANTYAYLSWSADRTAVLYGLQIEAAKYASSMYPQGDTLVARSAATLAVEYQLMVPAGYWDIQQTVCPRYANGQTLVDHDLWYLDVDNRLYLEQATGKLRLLVAGVEQALSSAAPTWSADQSLTIRHWNTPTSTGFTLSGATTGDETVLGATGTAAAPGAYVYLLGNDSGAQECASLDAPIVRYPV